MCGIVGAAARRDIVPVLIEGLRRLEYRGYDSCGVAVAGGTAASTACAASRASPTSPRQVDAEQLDGDDRHRAHALGDARRAVTEQRAPDLSRGEIAVVHNGIIENHEELRAELQGAGLRVRHPDRHRGDRAPRPQPVRRATCSRRCARAVKRLHRRLRDRRGVEAASRTAWSARAPAARWWSALGEGENFLASDALALAGDHRAHRLPRGRRRRRRSAATAVASSTRDGRARRARGAHRQGGRRRGRARPVPPLHAEGDLRAAARGRRHARERRARIDAGAVRRRSARRCSRGVDSRADPRLRHELLRRAGRAATGSRASPACPARSRSRASTATATACRIRSALVVAVSQSGETADTLAALKHAKSLGQQRTLAICNVATSAMVRETRAALPDARRRRDRRRLDQGVHHPARRAVPAGADARQAARPAQRRDEERSTCSALRHLPAALSAVLALEPQIIAWAERFARRSTRCSSAAGLHYPIALEGALKLKEISYIHAEAYPAGELKHGPLALVDREMPVVAVAPNDALLEKLKSNMQEVRARGGELYVFADADTRIAAARRRPRDPAARARRAAVADPARGAAAAARLSHRAGARHRRRQAAQPGEIGHRGITYRPSRGGVR